jgi:hypothetical protein
MVGAREGPLDPPVVTQYGRFYPELRRSSKTEGRERMKKLMLAVVLAAVIILAMPATASAHKLRKGFAVQQSRAVAEDFAFSHFFFSEQDAVIPVDGYTSREFCTRFSQHKIRCAVGWVFDDVNSDDAAACVGDAKSKLKRRSNKVVTSLRESDVGCELVPAAANARAQVRAAQAH